ncbi:MAG: SpoIIE family protein phosphatase [Oscillospiraceae bacterium]|jgi:stage II sporulation protein E|nr:SpoIIE family protein phosphatase [Oscillospiraceae bacterium]
MSTNTVLSKPKNRNIKALVSGKSEILKGAMSFVIGFVMSYASMVGSLSPFGAAVVAAAPPVYAVQVMLGACLAYIIPGILGGSMKYFAAVLLIGIIKILAGRIFRVNAKEKRYIAPVLAFVVMGGLSAYMLIQKDFTLYDIVMAATEALLAGGMAYFFTQAFILYENGLTAVSEKQDIVSVVLAFSAALIALSGVRIYGCSLGRFFAVFIILICAYKGGAGFGCMAGVTAGVSIGLFDTAFFPITAAYGLAGIIAGLFSGAERIGVAASFIAVNGLLALLNSSDQNALTLLFEVMGASVLFMLTPQKLLSLFSFGKVFDGANVRADAKELATTKLSFAAGAMRDVGRTVEVVSEKLSGMERMDIASVFMDASQSICKRCSKCRQCWEDEYQNTINYMYETVAQLRRDGQISQESFPEKFKKKCAYPQEIAENINTSYYRFSSKENARRRIDEIRSIVAEQFGGISDYLEQLGQEFQETENLDFGTARTVKKYFEKYGVEPISVNCGLDKYTRMSLEITLRSDEIENLNRKKIGLDLSELCDRVFELPCLDKAGKVLKLSLYEKASYSAEFGEKQIACGEERLCGDTLECFSDLKGMAYMILSDGMGSGPAAAVDSAMAASLISRLVKAGFNFSAALKMVNSALLVKSVDESLATADITGIDLYTGQATFIKAGAAPTFVRRKGKAIMIEGDSLPIGILKGVDLYKKTLFLGEDDMVLMVSDGVTTRGENWLIAELEGFAGYDMDLFARQICEQAKKRRIDGHDDDVSAAACIIRKGI